MARIDTLANRLQVAITDMGLKQVDLSAMTSVSKASLSHYISGRCEPRPEVTNRIARALDVSDDWLLGYDCPMMRTDSQKMDDDINDIVTKLQNDPDYLLAAKLLYNIDGIKINGINQMLKAFQSD